MPSLSHLESRVSQSGPCCQCCPCCTCCPCCPCCLVVVIVVVVIVLLLVLAVFAVLAVLEFLIADGVDVVLVATAIPVAIAGLVLGRVVAEYLCIRNEYEGWQPKPGLLDSSSKIIIVPKGKLTISKLFLTLSISYAFYGGAENVPLSFRFFQC